MLNPYGIVAADYIIPALTAKYLIAHVVYTMIAWVEYLYIFRTTYRGKTLDKDRVIGLVFVLIITALPLFNLIGALVLTFLGIIVVIGRIVLGILNWMEKANGLDRLVNWVNGVFLK